MNSIQTVDLLTIAPNRLSSTMEANEQSDMYADDDNLHMELKALLNDILECRSALAAGATPGPCARACLRA